MYRCIPDLDRFNFKLNQYNRATLNSVFKSDRFLNFFKIFWQAFLMCKNGSAGNGTSPRLSPPPLH